MLEVQVVTKSAEAAIERFGREVGTAPEMEKAKLRIGQLELQAQKRDFVERSQPGRPPWPELSPVTIVLRRRGRGSMIYGEEQLEFRRWKTKKMRDEGLLLASLTAGAPDNVLEAYPFAIHIGTTRPGARTHQGGGSSTFIFDREKQKRFDENVSRTKKGRRVKPLPPGHKYRWGQGAEAMKAARKERRRQKKELGSGQFLAAGFGEAMKGDYYSHGIWWHLMAAESPWNRLYFRLRNYMRKISGTSRRIPKREIIVKPPDSRVEKYAAMYEKGLAALAKRLGL